MAVTSSIAMSMRLRAGGEMKEGAKGFKKVRTSVLVTTGEKRKRKNPQGQHCVKNCMPNAWHLTLRLYAGGEFKFRLPEPKYNL